MLPAILLANLLRSRVVVVLVVASLKVRIHEIKKESHFFAGAAAIYDFNQHHILQHHVYTSISSVYLEWVGLGCV